MLTVANLAEMLLAVHGPPRPTQRSLADTTSVIFADCPPSLLASYVEHGEGVDRAGGWAIQGLGSVLVKKIIGDFNNVKGFPAHAFYAFMQDLIDKEIFPADE